MKIYWCFSSRWSFYWTLERILRANYDGTFAISRATRYALTSWFMNRLANANRNFCNSVSGIVPREKQKKKTAMLTSCTGVYWIRRRRTDGVQDVPPLHFKSPNRPNGFCGETINYRRLSTGIFRFIVISKNLCRVRIKSKRVVIGGGESVSDIRKPINTVETTTFYYYYFFFVFRRRFFAINIRLRRRSVGSSIITTIG